jgi:hypothetical protein
MKTLMERIDREKLFNLLEEFYIIFLNTNNPFYDGAIKGALSLVDFFCIEQIESRIISLEKTIEDMIEGSHIGKNISCLSYYMNHGFNGVKFRNKDINSSDFLETLGELCVLDYLNNYINSSQKK